MAYTLDYTADADADLAFFRKYEQVLILDTIDVQLVFEPGIETRNRKPLENHPLAAWELRIGQYRVFYDIIPETKQVTVKAVGWKDHNTLYLRGKAYTL